jgi:hypothetical protein
MDQEPEYIEEKKDDIVLRKYLKGKFLGKVILYYKGRVCEMP